VTAGHVDWYAARAAGVVAYVLLTFVVLLGTTLSGRVRLPRWPAFAVTDVHRFASVLVGAFLGVHVLTIALDAYTPFSLAQLVVPGASSYRPLWVALGIVAAELLVAVAVTNALRGRIPHRVWRRVHYLTFLVWAGGTAHGIGAGTDAGAAWLRALYALSIAAVLAAVLWRVLGRRFPETKTLRPAAAAALFGLALVLGLGRLPHGLGTGSARASAAPARPPATVSDSFSGSVEQQQGSSGALVSVVGKGSGDRAVLLRIDLVALGGGTVADTSLQLEDLRTGAVCTGTVSSIDGRGFSGTCSFPGGDTRTVGGDWEVAGSSVSGRVRLTA
jgi:sulfoxide reductase heme-binding subunit YedZ